MNSPYECVKNIHDQTNQRIYDRNIPSQVLQPYLDVRPVMTKYSYLPIVDPRKEVQTRFIQSATYQPQQVFNPGNTKSPWSGYASNINNESILRNQVFALQRSNQAVYVPNSNSDLYHVEFQTKKTPAPESLLFKQERFESFNPNPDQNNVGYELFHNSTRVQLMNMKNNQC